MSKRFHKKGLSRRPRGAPARPNRSRRSRPAYARAPGKGHAHEAGFVDLGAASYPLDTTGSVDLIAIVPVGPSTNERIGKRIMWKSLQVRGQCVAGTAGVTARGCWLIVYDKRPTGIIPSVTDIVESTSADAFNNDDNSGRFRILRRNDVYVVGSTTTPVGVPDTGYAINDYIDLKGKPSTFKSAGTGGIGDIEEGALYLVTYGNNLAVGTPALLAVTFRTRYVDV